MAFTFTFQSIYKNTAAGVTYPVGETDSTDTSVTIIGDQVSLFATRIYDVRWAARRFLRMCNRKGVICYYYAALDSPKEDINEFIGSLNLSGTDVEREFITGTDRTTTNPRISHLPPVMIKVLQPNYLSNVDMSEKGHSLYEEAEITAPAVAMFNKWDILVVQDKNWVVVEEPKLIYNNKSILEGFKLTVRSLRSGVTGY